MFMDIFELRTFLYFLSDIHSLGENDSSAEGVYTVFVALQVNPSLQKIEWVQPFLSFSLVKIFLLMLLYTLLDGCLIQDHNSNKMVVCIPDSLS